MGKRTSRRGSQSVWHRRRAARMVPRVAGWANHGKVLPEALLGYKVGMTSILYTDDADSPTKGQDIVVPVTVIEVPPLFVYSITLLGNTPLGLKVLTEVTSATSPKNANRTITPSKKSDLSKLDKFAAQAADVRIKMISIPEKTGLGKKTPEIFEAPIGGTDAKAKIEYAKGILGKELTISDIISEGDYLDAIAVTTGKGWQGVVKRYGVALNTHKSTKARRHGGSIGPETQAKVMYTIPRAGQMGFHRRVDKAKRVMMISQDAKQILPVDGFAHYGLVKSPYILIDGSVPGPKKRAILLRKSVLARATKKPVIKEIGKESKQG